jgi:hypothetical protein
MAAGHFHGSTGFSTIIFQQFIIFAGLLQLFNG